MKKKIALLTAGIMALAMASLTVSAEEFPSKTMSIVCPYGAGGGTDVALRILAECGQDQFGQTINVENKTGGSGSIGLVETLNAAHDGYTLGTASVDLITLPLLGLAPEEVTRDAFDTICTVNAEPAAIIVSADSEYQTLEDFVQAAVDNPGSIQLANAGMGNIWHLSAIGVELETGAVFNHIPYADGAAQAITGVLGGHVDAVVCSIPEAAANIESGELKVLGVAANERLADYPDVPTYKECGIDLTIMAVRGLCVAADTPDDVKEVLKSGFEEVINSDACKEKVEAAGMTYMPLNADDTNALLDEMSGSLEEIITKYMESNS
ncbi:MAG: tripartite tricarboxylate transporter substrate binding protein [Candidatus Choladocola sp.]|nr:tripartite tricarboxylate transporter substrate binding protein [Candidatus Choladocola sp.]